MDGVDFIHRLTQILGGVHFGVFYPFGEIRGITSKLRVKLTGRWASSTRFSPVLFWFYFLLGVSGVAC